MNINKISATQLSQYKSCPRKWYFRYVLGHKYPQTAAMEYGTAVHTDLEEYLNGEKDAPTLPEAVHIYNAGIIPERDKVYAVEIDVSEEKILLCNDRVALMGYIDLVWIDSETGRVMVWDWKTRSSYSYAPTSKGLLTDLQAILYSYAMFVHLDRKGFRLEELPFGHVNLLRKDRGGPDHQYVEATMSRADVEAYIKAHVEPQIYEMNEMASKALEFVPTHKSMCFEYGQCEHMENCFKVAYTAVATKESGELLNLSDLLPKEGHMNTINDLMNAGTVQTNGAAAPQPAPAQTSNAAPLDLGQMLGIPQQPQPQMPTQPQYTQPQQPQYTQPQQPQYTQPAPQMPTPPQYTQPAPQAPVVPEPQPEPQMPAAPNIQPPDFQPDIQPSSIADQTVQEFDWTGIDGIGAKGADKIKEYLSGIQVTHMRQLMNGFDFKVLPGIGATTAQNIRMRLAKGVPFNPNTAPDPGTLGVDKTPATLSQQEILERALEAKRQGIVPDLTHATEQTRAAYMQGVVALHHEQQAPQAPQAAQGEPSPEQWLQMAIANFDSTGLIPPYASQLPPELKQRLDAHVLARRAHRQANPDYAPPAPAPAPPPAPRPAPSDLAGLAAHTMSDVPAPALTPAAPIVERVVEDASGNRAVESVYAELFGVSSVTVEAKVGEVSMSITLSLDPTQDAVPFIEAARAYLNQTS